jgi:hypothetical protein
VGTKELLCQYRADCEHYANDDDDDDVGDQNGKDNKSFLDPGPRAAEGIVEDCDKDNESDSGVIFLHEKKSAAFLDTASAHVNAAASMMPAPQLQLQLQRLHL